MCEDGHDGVDRIGGIEHVCKVDDIKMYRCACNELSYGLTQTCDIHLYVSFNGFKSTCFVSISDDIAESNRFDDGVWIIHVLILI